MHIQELKYNIPINIISLINSLSFSPTQNLKLKIAQMQKAETQEKMNQMRKWKDSQAPIFCITGRRGSI